MIKINLPKYQYDDQTLCARGQQLNRVYQNQNVLEISTSFEEQSVRKEFVRKVYSIVLIQVLFSFAVVCFFQFCEPVKQVALQNHWIYWVATAFALAIMFPISCVEDLRRKSPINLIMLSLITLAISISLGVANVIYAPEMVFMAVGATAIVVLGLIMFAMQTKVNFTVFAAILLVMFLIIIIFGAVASIFSSKILNVTYSLLGVLVYALYLIGHTQLLMGEKPFALDPKEHICAAIFLYVGVVAMFMELLGLFNCK